MSKSKSKECTIEEEMRLHFSNLKFIPEPTRQFEIGYTEFVLGGLKNPIIIGKYYNGKIYEVESDCIEYGKFVGRHKNYFNWMSIFPKNTKDSFSKKETLWLNSYRTHIDSLLQRVYYFGVNLDPEYQRGIVWGVEDKRFLINSILNNIHIGRFVFNKLSYSDDEKYLYEIIDGKQRLVTLCEFYEDKLTYEGLKFSELSVYDRNRLTEFPIEVIDVENAKREQILETFLRVNETGKPVSKEHLDRIRSLLK